jgi:hypothetical protein
VLSEDDRVFIGILRRFSPHLTLEGAMERIFVGRQYSDIPIGLQGRFLVQRDTVAFIALFNDPTLAYTHLERVSPDLRLAARARARDEYQEYEAVRARELLDAPPGQVVPVGRAIRDWLALINRIGWLVPLYGQITG